MTLVLTKSAVAFIGFTAAVAGLLFGAPLTMAASPPSALGPAEPIATPVGGFVGAMTLLPEHGPAGTLVQVDASGLAPGKEYDLVWRTIVGSWKVENAEYHGRAYQPAAYRIAVLKADEDGKLSTRFTAPEDFGFSHDVVLQQGTRLIIQAGFALDMNVSLSPTSGPIGTPITVKASGIGWRNLENSWMLAYDNGFSGWLSAVTTQGVAEFTIPATGAIGEHVLDIIHGAYTFPYLNPQQNPVPDRPRFSLRFTVTDGAPVLPPAPEVQAQTAVRNLPPPGNLVASPLFSGIAKPVTVTGSGFAPGKHYELAWNSVTGNRVAGNGWEESARPIAEATADSTGAVAFHFAVPDDLGGAHRLSVQDGAAQHSGTYWITPTALALDVGRGPVGTAFAIHLKGVGWTETANIYTLLYDNHYLGYACGFNSQGDVTIYLKATGAPGWHYVDLIPAIYKGQESAPDNFRIPQLTYAQDHPGEDLPAFHFAFEVTDEKQAKSAAIPGFK